MGWILTLLVGAFIGWIAGKVMDTGTQQGWVLNMLIGIIGSALGRWLFGDVLHIGAAWRAGHFSLAGIAFGVLGSAVLIAILKWLGVLR
ncbi:putative membrane protein YeaQ/YmgE (transglycosylase-associated protein family) [Silvimonas terrae]|uniref:Putative membrane protein YeaQ/YmgE (Transglycosylase-associated protein family) n=1 Tax=Silvimonas terrae TaxID=300266 RepID=A0A840RLX2_9NEIS|nr:GlsB/YeaQ/YmgE family stress response membrane protein [Silvimonas terrae]MBB5193276.1 putative membrane protein YeaQ/YmgE (transglycosylase-associated protein family) [Silvimonas terrae]